MRISDWSSDVCSSDLSGALQPAHARQFAGQITLPWRSWTKSISVGSCHLPWLASTEKALTMRSTVVSPAPSAIERRSEEHTSELQSLMRISSAVFCLTKKKKIQNSKTTLDKQH